MPTLIARKPHRYDGRLWRKGQTFTASADDALVLKAIGVADDALPPIYEPSANSDVRAAAFERGPVAGGEAPVLAQQDWQLPKRPRGRPRKVQTYATREMIAETYPPLPEPLPPPPAPPLPTSED